MARITNQETSAAKSRIEFLAQAKVNQKEETSSAQDASEIQEIVMNQDEVKAAKDFANEKKSDGQLQAAILKGQLNNTAGRLDQFREGDLKGLQKDAKKFANDALGVIKDNLGNAIARHDGPGIKDMYNRSKKYDMPNRDPLKDFPKAQSDSKKGPETPFKKNDPSLVSKDGNKKSEPNVEVKVGKITMLEPKKVKPDKIEVRVGKITEIKPEKVEVTVGKITVEEPKKPKKYVDPDQIDATRIDKPKDPPPTAHDKLGHKVNPLNGPIVDTENVNVKKLVAEHKGPKKSQIYVDPDQVQQTMKVDPANPPRIEENELQNTGNPNDPNRLQFELRKSAGEKPHTDGEANDNQP
jgi:hypothetical protein